MTTHSIDPTPVRPLPAAGEAAGATEGAPASLAFRGLLERLENLARAPASEVSNADDLQHALRRAEDDYVAAMDLRRRLEDAVRGGR